MDKTPLRPAATMAARSWKSSLETVLFNSAWVNNSRRSVRVIIPSRLYTHRARLCMPGSFRLAANQSGGRAGPIATVVPPINVAGIKRFSRTSIWGRTVVRREVFIVIPFQCAELGHHCQTQKRCQKNGIEIGG